MCYTANETYRKDRVLPPGTGWGRRLNWRSPWLAARLAPPSAIIIHATHGRTGSAATAEAAFLRDSSAVSAHYLVGRDGILYRVLPDDCVAWHAGEVIAGFGNAQSIGIELHASTSEPILETQKMILGSLCHALIEQLRIVKPMIDTHRAVALPKGRKTDPATWFDADFYAWRERLYLAV